MNKNEKNGPSVKVRLESKFVVVVVVVVVVIVVFLYLICNFLSFSPVTPFLNLYLY